LIGAASELPNDDVTRGEIRQQLTAANGSKTQTAMLPLANVANAARWRYSSIGLGGQFRQRVIRYLVLTNRHLKRY
jgi:hypothetical protein